MKMHGLFNLSSLFPFVHRDMALPGSVAPHEGSEACRLIGAMVKLHRALANLPPFWRERVAERFLRREHTPGPAAEHVTQYLLSAAKADHHGRHRTEAVVVNGANQFYRKQYRQYLNATMGAFAMTATQAFLAAGGAPHGLLWRRYRRTFTALHEGIDDASPILVLDDQSVAIPFWLPQPRDERESAGLRRWLRGLGAIPPRYGEIIAGEAVRSAERSIVARERGADGAALEIIDAVLESRRLAVLALHPHDPDAMGLHITLFAVELLEAEQVEGQYGLAPGVLAAHCHVAQRLERPLFFAVGATEEVFTQCSQNLFVKRPVMSSDQAPRRPAPGLRWDPGKPLEKLASLQFEAIQATVSASGLPGASPRNGDQGKAVFVGRREGKVFFLIPYHPGNAIHGHAAKLWSNPYGSLVISDDHHALTRVSVSGPARVVEHRWVQKRFPGIAAEVAAQHNRHEVPLPDPEYWFLQEVTELVQQREGLAANTLEPGRSTCSISAGGQARHGKKPAYFAADSLPPYDLELQHRREQDGRPVDPEGARHCRWLESVGDAWEARRAHLQQLNRA